MAVHGFQDHLHHMQGGLIRHLWRQFEPIRQLALHDPHDPMHRRPDVQRVELDERPLGRLRAMDAPQHTEQ